MVAAVLSGNRNFEGRINPLVRANYLASPPLVVAYAIAGRVDIDLQNEPIGLDEKGKKVYLKEIWPTTDEVNAAVKQSVRSEMFEKQYSEVFEGDAQWNGIRVPLGDIYEWEHDSTYIQTPPYFDNMVDPTAPIQDIAGHASAGDAGRFGDHGSHFAGGFDSGGQSGREVSDRPRREAGRFQFLRRAPRQS